MNTVTECSMALSAPGHIETIRFGELTFIAVGRPHTTITRESAGMWTPCNSTSRVEVRDKVWVGDSKRNISSTAVGQCDSSFNSRSRCSGWRSSRTVPEPIRLAVVSWPPRIRVGRVDERLCPGTHRADVLLVKADHSADHYTRNDRGIVMLELAGAFRGNCVDEAPDVVPDIVFHAGYPSCGEDP
ncbi:hypothetical protein P3H80_08850 [Mycolicibacterium septicum]|uniref:hypothetical protein n=1 Tax=Mycolicibacterium septicum TaxID=98668 RepID=UPI0023E335B4|nr:hypothetical protein [Mycolicibacterium septicum]MDF3337527.1 hypothetical protein [Mycolicibacterium septicum]